MLASACCRCLWPLTGGGAKFPKPAGEGDRDEEAVHLLDNVIESDDEQADPLSSDEIKRYLDESKSRTLHSEESDGESSTTGWDRNLNKRSRAAPLMGPGAYDELFEEELAESEDVVIGAKPWASKPVEFGNSSGSLSGSDAPSYREGSLSDWIDAADEPPPVWERGESLLQASTGALSESSRALNAMGGPPSSEFTANGIGKAMSGFDKSPHMGGDFLDDFSEYSPRVLHGAAFQGMSPGHYPSNGLPGDRYEGDTLRGTRDFDDI